MDLNSFFLKCFKETPTWTFKKSRVFYVMLAWKCKAVSGGKMCVRYHVTAAKRFLMFIKPWTPQIIKTYSLAIKSRCLVWKEKWNLLGFCRGHELNRNESSLAVSLFCCLLWGIEIWSDFNSYCQAPGPHRQLSCIFWGPPTAVVLGQRDEEALQQLRMLSVLILRWIVVYWEKSSWQVLQFSGFKWKIALLNTVSRREHTM